MQHAPVNLVNLDERVNAHARINVRRLAKTLFLSLVLPVLLAGVIDAAAGTYPWFVIAASVLCIPLATFIVIRMALAELDAVIRQVTPEPLPEQAPEKVVSGHSPAG